MNGHLKPLLAHQKRSFPTRSRVFAADSEDKTRRYLSVESLQRSQRNSAYAGTGISAIMPAAGLCRVTHRVNRKVGSYCHATIGIIKAPPGTRVAGRLGESELA